MKSAMILSLHGLVGWVLCGAVMGLGLAATTEHNAQIIHLMAAPIFFAGISWFYASRFGITGPLQTAAIFLALILLLDLFVVSLLIMGSFAMFQSVLGTWLPMALIFLASWLGGRLGQPGQGRAPG